MIRLSIVGRIIRVRKLRARSGKTRYRIDISCSRRSPTGEWITWSFPTILWPRTSSDPFLDALAERCETAPRHLLRPAVPVVAFGELDCWHIQDEATGRHLMWWYGRLERYGVLPSETLDAEKTVATTSEKQ